jgi:hypothetical protein
MEAMVGRLSHASFGIPMARHCIARFYRLINSFKGDFQKKHLKKEDIQVLTLWKNFLVRAAEGTSLNLLTCCRPRILTITDACPKGMGGFLMNTGKAWRFRFPTALKKENNTGEFLAAVVSILTAKQEGDIGFEDVVLALTDNSSCAAWFHRCNVNPSLHPATSTISRKLASDCVDHGYTIHPQHIPGRFNNAADALGRRVGLSDKQLTHLSNPTLKTRCQRIFGYARFQKRFPLGSAPRRYYRNCL